MLSALYIKSCLRHTTLSLENIPELTKDDIQRISKKHTLMFKSKIDSSVDTLPKNIHKLLAPLCTRFDGVLLGISVETLSARTLFAFAHSA